MSAEPHQKFINTLLHCLDQADIPFKNKLHILVLLSNFVIRGSFNNKLIIVRHALKMHGVNDELVHVIEEPKIFSTLAYSAEEYKTHYNNLVKKLKLFSSNALGKQAMTSLIAKEYCAQRAVNNKDYFSNVLSAYHLLQPSKKKQQIIQNFIMFNLNKLHKNASKDKDIKNLVSSYVMELQHKAQMQQPLLAYTQQLCNLLPQKVNSKEIQQALTNFPHLLNIDSTDNFRKALEKEYANFAIKEYNMAYFMQNNTIEEKIAKPFFVPVQKMRLMDCGVTAIDYSFPDHQTVIVAYKTTDSDKIKLLENEVLLEVNPADTTEPILYKQDSKGTTTISHIPISAVSQIISYKAISKKQPKEIVDSTNIVVNPTTIQKETTNNTINKQ